MDLLETALQRLQSSWATAMIPAKVREPAYDAEFARRICSIALAKADGRIEGFERAIDDFIALSEEFVTLQMRLDERGRYEYERFEDVRRLVYDNPEVMEGRYLNGLFLSQAFWVNHAEMFRYFVREVCDRAPASGRALEVPCGTGFYSCEFGSRNAGWTCEAIDLSASSVAFTSAIARAYGAANVTVRQGDVFALAGADRYDRILCGELLEHLEDPVALLRTLAGLLAPDGRIFLTTAIWAASIDHIYLFRSAREVREMLTSEFHIESDLALAVRDGFAPDAEKTPINYACVLSRR